MAFTHGDSVIIKASGAGLSYSSEACTEIDATHFQVTNTAKRVMSPTAALVIKANTVVQVLGTDYTVDRLLGIITFLASKTGQTVIVFSGTYLPMTAVAQAENYKMYIKKNNGESNVMNGGGWKTRAGLLWDAGGSLTEYFVGDHYLRDAFGADTPIVIEETLSGTLHCRQWAYINSYDADGPANAFVKDTITWDGTPDTDGNVISFA